MNLLFEGFKSYYKKLEEESNGSSIIYTYQSPEVLKQLKEDKTYFASCDRGLLSKAYKELSRVLGLDGCPIFCGLDEEETAEMMKSSGLDVSTKSLLKLKVPNKFIHKMAYYDWTDYIYYWVDKQEEDSITKEEAKDSLRSFSGQAPCQVVIDRIEPSWLIDEALTESDDSKQIKLNKNVYIFVPIEMLNTISREGLKDFVFSNVSDLSSLNYILKWYDETFYKLGTNFSGIGYSVNEKKYILLTINSSDLDYSKIKPYYNRGWLELYYYDGIVFFDKINVIDSIAGSWGSSNWMFKNKVKHYDNFDFLVDQEKLKELKTQRDVLNYLISLIMSDLDATSVFCNLYHRGRGIDTAVYWFRRESDKEQKRILKNIFSDNIVEIKGRKSPENRKQAVYLYRGTSERTFSKNFEAYAGIFFSTKRGAVSGWGETKKYLLKSNAKIYRGDDSSDNFCSAYYNKEYPELQKCFGMYFGNLKIKKISDFSKLTKEQKNYLNDRVEQQAGTQFCDYDVWTWCTQLVARIELEKQGYDGAYWTSEDFGNPTQYQIWNLDVVKSYDGVIESISESKQSKPELEEVDYREWTKHTKLKDVLDIWADYYYEGEEALYTLSLYHGTTDYNWKKIKKDCAIKPNKPKNFNSKNGCIYLTSSKDDAYEFAYRSFYGDECATVIEVDINGLDLDKLYIDTNIEEYTVYEDEKGKEYWDFWAFEYYGEIPESAWIDVDIDESLNESKQELLDTLYSTNSPEYGSCYLLDDGTFVFPFTKEDKTPSAFHGDEEEIITDKLNRELKYDYNVVVLNSRKPECRMNFSGKPTDSQYRALLDWLYFVVSEGNDKVDFEYYDTDDYGGKYTTISLKDKMPEEIIDSIKRYFISGILIESKQDTLNFKNWVDSKVSEQGMTNGGNKDAYVNSFINDFEKNRSRLKPPYNDYYYWIKNNNWDEFTKALYDIKQKDDTKQKAQEGAKLLYNKDGWKVYEITTYEASAKYGKNTKWCISGSKRWNNNGDGTKFWNDYTKQGCKFYFFIKNNNEKYALVVYPDDDNYEIFNQEDVPLAYIPNAPDVKEISVNYNDDSDSEFKEFTNLFVQHKLPYEDFIIDRVLGKINGDCDGYMLYIYDSKDAYIEFREDIPDNYIEYYFENNHSFDDYGGDYPYLVNFDCIVGDMEKLSSASEFWELTKSGLNKYNYFIFADDGWDGNFEAHCHNNFSDALINMWQLNFWCDGNFSDFIKEFARYCLNEIKWWVTKTDEIDIQPYLNLGFTEDFLTK